MNLFILSKNTKKKTTEIILNVYCIYLSFTHTHTDNKEDKSQDISYDFYFFKSFKYLIQGEYIFCFTQSFILEQL